MKKINLEELKAWATRANEEELLVAKAQYQGKVNLAEFVLFKIIQPRLDYLETINFENCTRRAKSLEIEPPMASE
jgi:hypothetical protein